jgi:hypothetical protein
MRWTSWATSKGCEAIPIDHPLLASWMANSHPDQTRLTKYLDEVRERCPLPSEPGELFLHLQVGVASADKLTLQPDLENYLTPLLAHRCIGPHRFVLVRATKRVGQAHSIRLGYAIAADAVDMLGGSHFQTELDAGLESSVRKELLRARIAGETQPMPMDGPIEVKIAWRCSSRRNWTNLWKPTGDAMGPILGVTHSKGFNPRDDRITTLTLQREVDDTLGNAIQVGIWWRIDTLANDSPP